jgi:hypothetical protein
MYFSKVKLNHTIDHVSYITLHDQLVDTFQHLGARLGSTFIDGGIHPRFGTRNFTLPLRNGHYLEFVCPLDHPTSDQLLLVKLFHNALQKVADGLLGLLQLMMFPRLRSV